MDAAKAIIEENALLWRNTKFSSLHSGSPKAKSKNDTLSPTGQSNPNKRSLLDEIALAHVMRVNEKKAADSGRPSGGRQVDAKQAHSDVMASIKNGNHQKVDISYQGLVGLPDSAPVAEKVVDKRKLTLHV